MDRTTIVESSIGGKIKTEALMLKLKMIYPFVFVVGDLLGLQVYHLETGECIRHYQHSYGYFDVQTNGRFLVISGRHPTLTFDIQEKVTTNYNYDYSNYDGLDYDYDYDYNSTSLDARRKKPEIEFRVNADNECRVLPSNCNPEKFNFVDCTNDNKYVWQNKELVQILS